MAYSHVSETEVAKRAVTLKRPDQLTATDIYVGKIEIKHGSLRPQVFSNKQPLSYGYNNYLRAGSMVPSEYDLMQIMQAENIDGYMKRAVKIKTGNMFKSGWKLVGKNPKTVKYIKQRFRQLEMAGGYPFELLIRDMGRNFIRYSNAFLVKVRNKNNSSGRTRKIVTKKGTKTLAPVTAYFLLPPESVYIETDQDGHIKRYHQLMPRGRRKWYPWDVVHFFYDRKAGYHMGTPVFWPALDDIRALRRMEENVEYLVYYYVFPFFAVYVGTDQNPPLTFADGTSEIDIVQRKIENMPTEGGLVLSYRHQIEPIEFKGGIDVQNYLKHFKERIFASLGVSSVDMGEGSTSNRNTADSLTRQMIDDVKDYQQVFAAFVDYEIITELLLESPWGWDALDEENMVHFSFNEIDVDNRIKVENHNALMYQMNFFTEDEARDGANRGPLTDEDRKKLYINLIQKPLAEMGQKTEAALNSAAKTKQQPTNQHGTKASPEKAKSSLNEKPLTEAINTLIDDFVKPDSDLTLEDLKKKLLSIDAIANNNNILHRIELFMSFFDGRDDLENDRFTAGNILSVLLNRLISEATDV